MKYSSQIVNELFKEQVENYLKKYSLKVVDLSEIEALDKKYSWRFEELKKTAFLESNRLNLPAPKLLIVDSPVLIQFSEDLGEVTIFVSKNMLINFSLYEGTSLIKHEYMHFLLNPKR